VLPSFKSWTVHKIVIEYLTSGLLSSFWNIYHSTTAYFLTHHVDWHNNIQFFQCTSDASLVSSDNVLPQCPRKALLYINSLSRSAVYWVFWFIIALLLLIIHQLSALSRSFTPCVAWCNEAIDTAWINDTQNRIIDITLLDASGSVELAHQHQQRLL